MSLNRTSRFRRYGSSRTWPSSQERREADAFYADLMGLRVRSAYADGGRRLAVDADEAEAAPVTLPAGFRMGVWVDVGGLSLGTNASEHASRLHALGITDACITINSNKHEAFGFRSTSQARIRAFAALLAGSTIQLTLTSWLRPRRRFIDDLVRDLPAFARDVGARAIDFDVEEPWTGATPNGFRTHDEAAEHLFSGLRAASAPEITVNCQVDQTDRPALGALVRNADIVIPQAYSAPGGTSHAVGGAYGPRGIQRRAAQKVAAGAAMSGKPIIMGLAAYKRTRWAGHSARDILTMELQETVALAGSHAIRGARYWSWKWIAGFDGKLGRLANGYANTFLQDIALP